MGEGGRRAGREERLVKEEEEGGCTVVVVAVVVGVAVVIAAGVWETEGREEDDELAPGTRATGEGDEARVRRWWHLYRAKAILRVGERKAWETRPRSASGVGGRGRARW